MWGISVLLRNFQVLEKPQPTLLQTHRRTHENPFFSDCQHSVSEEEKTICSLIRGL